VRCRVDVGGISSATFATHLPDAVSISPEPLTSLASSSTFTAPRPAMMIALASAVFCGGGIRAL
jgi:hypothetical protein